MITDKARFIHQYYGQRILRVNFNKLAHVGQGGWNLNHPDFYIEVTPLSKITNEDAIAVAKIFHPEWENPTITYNDETTTTVTNGRTSYGDIVDIYADGEIFPEESNKYASYFFLKAYDYLRSKGYLIPWREYTCEQILDNNWARLK